MKVNDPVCKMVIEDTAAAGTSTYKDVTYYFCAMGCKEKFDNDPEAFVGDKPAAGPKPVKLQFGKPAPSEGMKVPGVVYTCPMDPEIKQEGPLSP